MCPGTYRNGITAENFMETDTVSHFDYAVKSLNSFPPFFLPKLAPEYSAIAGAARKTFASMLIHRSRIYPAQCFLPAPFRPPSRIGNITKLIAIHMSEYTRYAITITAVGGPELRDLSFGRDLLRELELRSNTPIMRSVAQMPPWNCSPPY